MSDAMLEILFQEAEDHHIHWLAVAHRAGAQPTFVSKADRAGDGNHRVIIGEDLALDSERALAEDSAVHLAQCGYRGAPTPKFFLEQQMRSAQDGAHGFRRDETTQVAVASYSESATPLRNRDRVAHEIA